MNNSRCEGEVVGTAKRPGRPWAEARGSCKEINDLVHTLRGWLDASNVSVARLHRLLTPEHFGESVPQLWRLREQLNGVGLSWELAEAVADVCFPAETGQQAAERLAGIRLLWIAAGASPTPEHPDAKYGLVEAQQRTIAALEELNRVRQALEVSEQARLQALHVATYLFGLLGQTHAQVAQLTRELDAIRATSDAHPAEVVRAAGRLERAQKQTADLRLQLARAEEERDRAQQVADLAARQISQLENELRELRRPGQEAAGPAPVRAEASLPAPAGASADDDALDQIDMALQKARDVLDREHEAVQEVAEDVGWWDPEKDSGSRVVRGETVSNMPSPINADGDTELFETISDNAPASSDALNIGAELAVRREGARVRYAGAATRRIARGLDLDEIVLGLCRATVPAFSDEILVYLRDPLPVGDERPVAPFVLRLRRTDRLRLTDLEGDELVLVPDPDPTPAAELCEVRSGSALAEVLRGVRPVFGDSAAARTALGELLGPEHPLPRGLRAILAPLRGRRRVIGAAVFLRRAEQPAFDPDDLLVGAQLATHTALGIEKAVLYDRDSSHADLLQRKMLPDSLPQPTGVKLASRYLPAAETARVGGDWYDAIPLPGSRVALVVGDVMGHSMTSAAIMGQLRTTAHILAGLDLPPNEVLQHFDEQAQRFGEDYMATCIYVVYDPASHRITVANAGHPPPVLLHKSGHAEVLRVPAGAPIGVGGVDFEAVELDAPPGSTLLLYTDGLVESRLRDVWIGIEQLRERLAAAQLTGTDHAPPLEALCDDVLGMLGPGDRDDDTALLAARFDGIAPGSIAYWFLEPEDAAPGRARRLARRALARWNLEELTDSAALLISEVVTNAVRYAERPVTLRLWLRPLPDHRRRVVLRCEVGDDSPQLPRQRRARETDEAGRGLFVVRQLASRWGATRLSGGKVVWFEMALTPQQSARAWHLVRYGNRADSGTVQVGHSPG
ncbi:SpoIIE family protein phosphatase [Streptomyces hydrogenans]|uniref:SpoIIE family protein phosphatase n=1 Tax=Streptomyces hydrogenans TaxID=1873719 RepID=UPI0035DCAFEB